MSKRHLHLPLANLLRELRLPAPPTGTVDALQDITPGAEGAEEEEGEEPQAHCRVVGGSLCRSTKAKMCCRGRFCVMGFSWRAR